MEKSLCESGECVERVLAEEKRARVSSHYSLSLSYSFNSQNN